MMNREPAPDRRVRGESDRRRTDSRYGALREIALGYVNALPGGPQQYAHEMIGWFHRTGLVSDEAWTSYLKAREARHLRDEREVKDDQADG
jgi:hypothetical protein